MLKSKKFCLIGIIALVIIVAIAAFYLGRGSVKEIPEETVVATEEEVIPNETTVEDRFFNRNNKYNNENGNRENRDEGSKVHCEVGEATSTSFHHICVDSINAESSLGKDTITCNFTLEKKIDADAYENLDELFKLYLDGESVEIDMEESSMEKGIIVCSAEKGWEKFEINFQSSSRSRRTVVYEYENPNK